MGNAQKVARKGARYTEAIRNQALAKLAIKGNTLNSVAKELGVSVPTLIIWKRKAKQSAVAESVMEFPRISAAEGTARHSDAASYEISRLRGELAKVMEERDRLRKGIAALIGN